MALRQWMVTHEWMVKPTPQTEWIERRGRLLWLAEIGNTIGAGLYLVSLFYNSLEGMIAGLLVIIFIKMLPHMIFLGKPWRFWRMIPPITGTWRTSWVARGMLFSLLFMGFAVIQIALTWLLPGTGAEIALKVLTGIAALLTAVYSGFAMSYCKSIPFWHSALLPVIFLAAGIADGFAFIMAIGMAGGQVDILAVENGSRILLIINALIIAAYLWRAFYTSDTARYSAEQLLRGKLAPAFWVGVAGLGIMLPLAISFASLFAGEASTPLLITAIAGHTVGAVMLKFVLLKAGIHPPLLPTTAPAYR